MTDWAGWCEMSCAGQLLCTSAFSLAIMQFGMVSVCHCFTTLSIELQYCNDRVKKEAVAVQHGWQADKVCGCECENNL